MRFFNKKVLFVFFFVLFLLISSSSIIFAAKKNTSGPEKINIQARDGFNLIGKLYRPKKISTSHKMPVVLLLHALGGDSDSWQNFPTKITNSGKAVFVLDLRGHGESVYNKFHKRRDWVNFTNKDFQKYPDDINFSIKYLKENYPELNTSKVGIVAANISANAAILSAKNNNKSIKTLILLSPLLTYKGMDSRIPLVAYGRNPVFIVVSKKDKESYYSSTELIKFAQGTKQLHVFPFGGNSVDILRFQPTSQSMIVDWLTKNLK